jgi:hypothetical protein
MIKKEIALFWAAKVREKWRNLKASFRLCQQLNEILFPGLKKGNICFPFMMFNNINS